MIRNGFILIVSMIVLMAGTAHAAPDLEKMAKSGNLKEVQKLVEGGAPITDTVMVMAAQKMGRKSSKLKVLEYLLDKGGNPNAELDGLTPLISAARGGSADGVRVLLGAGADSDKAGKYAKKDITPLGAALSSGKPELVKMLVEGGAPITDAAMVMASQKLGRNSSKLKVLEYLLGKGGDPNAELDGLTPLISAARGGSADGVRTLLEAGADPDKAGKYAKKDITPLGAALFGGKPEVVKMLVEGGAPITDAVMVTAAQKLGRKSSKLELLEYLLGKGGNPNAEMDGFTPLILAAMDDSVEGVRALLDAGADPDKAGKLGKQDITPLGAAILGDNPEVAKMLAEGGADVDAPAFAGLPAMDYAASMGKADLAKALAEAGADVNQTGALGIGAMHSAARKGDIDALQSLMKSGGDLNGRDDNGKTPLHHALVGGHADAAKMLLDAGADVNAADDNGVTPLMDAASSRSGAAVRTALEAGADPDAHDNNGGHAAEKGQGVDEAVDPIVEASPEIRKNRKAPKIEESGEVAAGGYSAPCEESGGDNLPAGADVCGASGHYQMVFSIIRENGSRAGEVVPPMCAPYDFKAGADYRIVVLEGSHDWEWECKYELKTTTGSGRKLAYKKETNIEHSERVIEVKTPKPAKKPEEEEEEDDDLKVFLAEDPDDGKFAFDESDEGILEIKVYAEVSGDIDPDTVEWTMDKIGNSKMTVEPERGANVTIRFEGMPDWNAQFGEKTITAKGGGQSDSVTVNVFFDPQARNNPPARAGRAANIAPNWFFYWAQTRAGKGFDPVYDPARKSCSGRPIVGQYDYKTDRLYLTDGIYSDVCAARVDGKHAERYDCYAETLRHESVHGRELKAWWGEGQDLPGCGVSDLPNNILKKLINHDSDLDLMPDAVEKRLAPIRGCDPEKSPSCEGVPWWLGVGDVEMNAYREGWDAWALCSAKDEDWSEGGQQWTDECE